MPDVEWHITDRTEPETLVNAAQRKPPRWRGIVLLLVIVIGIGLGLAYRSLPEVVPRPTSTPLPPTTTPKTLPARLYEAIDREARALADGDAAAFLDLQVYKSVLASQARDTFQAWGRPTDDRPLYSVIDFGLRTPDHAWADIRQFRNGRSFRETRFYVWEKDRWLRSDPDPVFWSDQTETLDTLHFHVIYFVEDRHLIPPYVAQLENIDMRLCDDLGCTMTGVTYTLALNSILNTGWPVSGDGRTIVFPSPRVTGVYDDARPIGPESRDLIFLMAASAIREVTGRTLLTREEPRAGDAILWMVARWAVAHVQDLPFNRQEVSFQNPLPLADLWEQANQSNQDVMYREAYAVIYFIGQEYGAQSIPKLLKALGTAQSFSDVIENGLGVPFAEFDRKWQAWAKQNVPSQ